MEEQKNISEIILYQTEDGRTKIEVLLENDTVWLTQQLMAELLHTTKQNISLHIGNVFKEGELPEDSVVKECLTTESLPTGETWSDDLPIQPPDAEKPLWRKVLFWGTIGH